MGNPNATASREMLVKFTAIGPTVSERMAKGKLLRKQTSRSSHAAFNPSTQRPNPVDLLEAQAGSRLTSLVPIRYTRMLASPFAFLRGSAIVMAQDLSTTPKTGLLVEACGDIHVANFGLFASAERKLIFGINDFDETLPGAWEWDLKRLATSALLAGRFLDGDKVICEEAARSVVKSYRERIQSYARMGNLELWNAQIDESDLLDALPGNLHAAAKNILAKARQRTHLQVLEKMTNLLDDEHRIVETKPLVVRETHTSTGRPVQEALGMFLLRYAESLPPDRRILLSRYRVVDVARKVVGIGSVGMRCWVIYMEGQNRDDPLFLQVKEAQPSVLEAYFGKSIYPNHGQRVVVGQKLIQGSPDIFLGWGELDGTQYYVRQMRDMKGGVNLEKDKFQLRNLPAYGELCGWALALAHAKSGDAATLAGYVGRSEALDESIARFATAYADQTERDYAAFRKAAKVGRIAVSSPLDAGL